MLVRRGDTIIEVMLAITIFAMVAVGGMTIMNHGAAAAQRSLEVTLVRQQMDMQAEALRVLHEDMLVTRSAGGDYAAMWRRLAQTGNADSFGKDPAATPITPFPNGVVSNEECINPSSITKAFVMNVERGDVVALQSLGSSNVGTALVYPRIMYGADGRIDRVEGIWIEAEVSPNVGTGSYVDFHIRACWQTIGQSQPVVLGTIVRLNEPLL